MTVPNWVKVKLSTTDKEFPLRRQTPGSKGIWSNCIFYIDQDIEECDYWVILDNLSNSEKTKCPKENVILVTGEPPNIKKYSSCFIRQFHTIITCHKDLKHNNVINTQQGLPWMTGAKFLINENKWDSKNFMSYDDFLNSDNSKKTKELSIIVSGKTSTPGHEQRVRFVNKLKETFGDRIDIFGRGFHEIEDKFDGIANYKYTIVLENNSYRDYWTEKLGDAFLCSSYPIYYGCPNIYDYFPKGSLAVIDIYNIEESFNHIKSIIASREYEKSLDLIKKSKELILNQYNLFPLIVNIINNSDQTRDVLRNKKSIKIFPENWIQKEFKNLVGRFIK
jgi:hypothetical protein